MVLKVLYIIAPVNFRDEEYFVPKEIFEKEGYKVITASKDVSVAKGSLGGQAKVDIDIKNVDIDEFDSVVFAGGNGALAYIGDPVIDDILDNARHNQIMICAICIAPLILAKNGALAGKQVTVWNGDGMQSKRIEEEGATYINESVVVDKNIITANGPESSKEFAEKIIEYM